MAKLKPLTKSPLDDKLARIARERLRKDELRRIAKRLMQEEVGNVDDGPDEPLSDLEF